MRRLIANFVELTAVLHVVLAALVFVDAKVRDRDARWALVTLVCGILGALPYVVTGTARARLRRRRESSEAADEGSRLPLGN